MRVRVDRGADAVYVNLTDRPIKESEEVADGIVVDYAMPGGLSALKFWMLPSGRMIRRFSRPTALRCRRLDDARFGAWSKVPKGSARWAARCTWMRSG